MSELSDWDITAGNNNSAPPDGWPENTMAYSDVNNTGREGMAVVARYYGDINGSLQAGGTANAVTITLNSGAAAYFQGMYFACEIGVDNTGATTINVNAIGLKNIINRDGSALRSGQLQAGGIHEFRYDGTNMQLMGTITGGDAVITGAELRADINTATPPTTEAVTATYNVFDADGTDQLASMGFTGDNALRISNAMHAGPVILSAQNAAGAGATLFHGNPDGSATLYHANVTTADTITAATGGLRANNTLTGAGFERVLTTGDDDAITAALALKADLASPALTGNPTAPTAAVNDNDTSIATTAFCVAQIADDAPTKAGGGATGTWGISISGTATTATNAVNVGVADESGDTTCSVLFVTAASGNLPAKSGTNLTFNSSSGLLTATSLAGAGSAITALNMANASTGTLAVLRGGTGVTTKTGTGSVVLSASPNFTGQPDVSSLAIPFWATSGQTSGDMTISTSVASGGANGDIHFRY